jgi:hypothetical protein
MTDPDACEHSTLSLRAWTGNQESIFWYVSRQVAIAIRKVTTYADGLTATYREEAALAIDP